VADDSADLAAIRQTLGELPAYLPEPVTSYIRQAVASLRNAEQSPSRITQLVAQHRRDQLEVPATALDVGDFIKSVDYLAHVQGALELREARAIEQLAGRQAAYGAQVVAQRRQFSAKGNASKKKTAELRTQKWLAAGKPLRTKHPTLPRSSGGYSSIVRTVQNGSPSSCRYTRTPSPRLTSGVIRFRLVWPRSARPSA
jgi:hypothetical protein